MQRINITKRILKKLFGIGGYCFLFLSFLFLININFAQAANQAGSNYQLCPTTAAAGNGTSYPVPTVNWTYSASQSDYNDADGVPVLDDTPNLAASTQDYYYVAIDDSNGFGANEIYTGAVKSANTYYTVNTSGLAFNTLYYWRVFVVDSYSTDSAWAYPDTTSFYTEIQLPTGCSAVNDSTSAISITESGTLTNLASGSSGVYFDCTGASCDTGINAWIQTTSDQATGLAANTSYTFQTLSRNQAGVQRSAWSPTCSTYTSANTPAAPTAVGASETTMNVNPVTGGAENSMAIYVEAGASCDGSGGLGYVQANGSIGASAVWQADGTWSTVTVTGLSAYTQYAFCAKARNNDGDETGFGSATAAYTLDQTAPTHDSVAVNATYWLPNNSNTYTITMKSTETGSGFGGSYGIMGLVNYQGENGGQYAGYFAWHPSSYVHDTDQMACTGGGYGSKSSGYGAANATLISCTYSKSGNQVTVVFTIRPTTSWPDLTDNDVSMYTSDLSNNYRGWTNFDTNFYTDKTAPGGSTTFPVNNTYYSASSWSTVAGTASDATSGVNYTEYLNCTSGSGSWYHWGGSSWVAGCSWGQGISKSGTNWSDSSVAAGNLTNGYRYELYTRVFDNSGNIAYISNPTYYQYDSGVPNMYDMTVNGVSKTIGETLRIYTITADNSGTYNSGLSSSYIYIGKYPYSTYGWNKVSYTAMTYGGACNGTNDPVTSCASGRYYYYYDWVIDMGVGSQLSVWTYTYDAVGNRGEYSSEYTVPLDNWSVSACGAGYYNNGSGCVAAGAGYYSPAGDDNRYQCSAGYYGSSTTNSVATCNGACTAGYYCTAGSTSATQNNCGAGNYCGSGSSGPTACPAGTYGSTANLTNSSCTGLCDAGRYGSSTGNTASTCNGACTANYYCPAGSTSATQNACPSNSSSAAGSGSLANCLGNAGYYNCQTGTCSAAGAGYYSPGSDNSRYQCSAGYYGSSTTNSTSSCDGACACGHYCGAGSTSSTQNDCSAGTYRASTGGTAQGDCSTASAGYYSPGGTCSQTVCDAGRYGTGGSSASTCTGQCTANYYCPAGSTSATQNACPSNSSSAAGSGSLANCLGNAGYYNCQTGTCSAAGAGYYSPGSDNSRYQCSAGYYGSSTTNSTSSCDGACACGHYCGAGSTSSTQNDCSAGTYRASTGGTAQGDCSTASAGYYSPGGTCGQTVCDAGRYGTGGSSASTCTGQCTANYYCPAGSTSATQNACPSNSSSAAGSGSLANCLGNAGYYNCQTGTCSAAGAGYYSPASDNSRYSCSAGYYGSSTTNSTSSCDGLCDAGRYGTAGQTASTCSGACAAGRYGDAANRPYTTDQCTGACTANYYCPAGSTSATQNACPSNSSSAGGSDALADCLGNAGYYNCQTGTCSVAGAGYYSPASDNSRYQCSAGYYGSSTTNSTSSCDGACACGHYCGAGSTSSTQNDCSAGTYRASTGGTAQGDCSTASAGYYSPGGTCSQTVCDAGRYGSSTGNTASTCNGACTANYYCPAGSTSATQNACPSNSSSAAGSGSLANCLGNAGYYNCQTGTCSAAGAGYYSPASDNSRYQCSAGYYGSSTTNSTSSCDGACACGHYCGAGSTSSTQNDCSAGTYRASTGGTAQGDCSTASAGYYSPGGTCGQTVCDAGRYGTGGSSASTCTGQCTANYYCPAGSTSATQNACPSNSSSAAGSGSLANCLGNAGYYNCQTGTCSAAGAGYYSPGSDNSRYQCSAGYYGSSTTNSTSSCDGACACGHYCGAGSTSSTQNDCSAGTYRASTGGTAQGDCSTASAGYYTPGGTCSQTVCDAGRYGTGGSSASTCTGQCTANYYCPAGSTSATQNACPSNSSSAAGSGSLANCLGNAGYYNCQTGTCSAAGAGYYSPGSDNSRYQCSAGYYGSSTTNSTSSCDGACTAGYYCTAGSTSATQNNCGAGNYCIAGSSGPTACPAGTYGSTANLTTSSCTGQCDAGYYGNGTGYTTSSCAGQCTAGYYCTAGSTSATQNNCGTGHYCGTGSSGPTDCPGGTYGSTANLTNSSCTGACTANYYCPAGSSSATQNACPSNSSSAGGSDALADCLGNAGYYNCQTGTCSAAGAGYYSPASDNSRYQCAAGYYGSSTTNSTSSCDGVCACGHYCGAGSTSSTQNDCSAGTYRASTGGTAQGDCSTASAGYYTPGGTCSQTVCDAGRYGTGGSSASTCSGACTANYYCPAGSSSATQNACPSNSSSAGGSDALADCLGNAGYYNCQTGTCSAAGAGYYSPASDNSRYQCAAGYYGSSTTNSTSSCDGACACGHYCGAGSTSSTQNDCSAGTYRTSTGGTVQGDCTSASVGYYAGGGTCSQTGCTAGTYTGSTGQSSCTTCECGYYCVGSANRAACSAGTYRESTGGTAQGDCTSASVGYYAGGGTCSQTGCTAGTYTGSTGQSSCSNCTVGYKCPGSSNRIICGNGYSSAAGASDCSVWNQNTPTDAGTYSSSASLNFSATPISIGGITDCTGYVDRDKAVAWDWSGSVGSDGSYTYASGVTNNTYYYRYSCTDPAGNESNLSAWSDGILVDSNTPDIVAIDAGASSGDRTSLASNTWFKYSDTGSDDQISFSWTNPGDPSGDTFYYELDANSNNDSIGGTESNTTNAYVDSISISEGTSYFHVKPKTGAGTWGTERIFIVKYDKSAPTGSALSWGTITASSIQVTPSGASDSYSGLHASPYYMAYDSGTSFESAEANSGWTASAWNPGSLSTNTAYAFIVVARDALTNQSSNVTPSPAYKYTLNVAPSCSAANDSISQITITESGAANISTGSSGVYFDCTGASCDTGINAWVTSATDSTTGLSANTSYTFQVKSRNGDATETAYGSTCSTYTSANTPAAPVVNGATSATLNVNPVTGGAEAAMAIYVEAGASCDGSGGLGYIQANGTISGSAVWQADATWSTVTVTGLSANTQYSFCAKARNTDTDETGFGSAASLYTLANGPTTPGHTNQATTSMRWTWVSGGSQTGYTYGSTSSCGTGTTTNAYWDESSLSANTAYTRYVRAYNGEVTPIYTGVLTIGPYYTSNTAPTCSAANDSASQITITESGGVNISTGSSGVYFDCTGASCDTSINAWVTSTSDSATGLSANTSYTFQVKSRNGDADETAYGSTCSTYTSASTPAAPTVNSPTTSTLNVNPVTGGAESALAIYIEAGASCDGNGGLGYIQADGSIHATNQVWQADATWSTVTVTGLSSDTQYAFCAKARNADNDETGFGSATAQYTSVNTPGVPTLSGATATSVQINNDPNSNPPTTEYAIYIQPGATCTGSGGWYVMPNGSPSAMAWWQTDAAWGTVTATELLEYTQYSICAKARSQAETGFSAASTFYTSNLTPSITSILVQPNPQTYGGKVTFVANLSSSAGNNNQIHICKTNVISGGSCTGGSWCDSTGYTNDKKITCYYTSLQADIVSSPNNYYAFVCDQQGNCSSSTSGTFTVDNIITRLKGNLRLKGKVKLW